MSSQGLPTGGAQDREGSDRYFDNLDNVKDVDETKEEKGDEKEEEKKPSQGLLRQFDFRKGAMPEKARVVGGKTNITVEHDKSSSVIVDPGSHILLDLENMTPNQSNDMMNDFTLTMDIKLNKLPKKNFFLVSLNDKQDRSIISPGEIQVYDDGGVGYFGIRGLTKIKPGKWTRVVITSGGGFQSGTRKVTTYVNGKKCASIDKPILNTKDGRFAMATSHIRLFQNDEKKVFDKIQLRYAEVRGECWTSEKVKENNFTNRIYSAIIEEEEEKKRKLFTSLSLQPLYKKPPPVWMHPAFGAEFGDAFLEKTGLEGGSLSVCLHVFSMVVKDMLRDQRDLLDGLDEDELQSLDTLNTVFQNAVSLSKQHAIAMKGGQQLVAFIRKFRIQHLEALQEGELMVIPGGVGGRPYVYVLERADDFSDNYRFVIVNTDPHWGLAYHECSAEVQPKLRYKQVVVFDDIPQEKIEQDAFWSLLFMLNTLRAGPDKVYDWLLPYLIDLPLEHAVTYTSDCEEVDWRCPQRANMAYYRVLLESYHYMMRRKGLTNEQAKKVSFAVRAQYLQMAYNDLRIFSSMRMGLSGSDFRLVEIAMQQVAYAAVKRSKRELLAAKHLAAVKKRLDETHQLAMNLPCTEQLSIDPPDKLRLDGRSLSVQDQWNYQPLFDRLLRKDSVDGLAGAPIQIPSYVPIDFLQVKRTVTSFEEALTALRWCDKMCTLTAVQGHCVKNINFLKVALIQHTFVHVLPVPKSENAQDYDDCVWNTQVVYGRQLDVLFLCQRIMEHFVSSVLSLKNNRPLDAVRIIIPACITAIADVMMRKEATDDPSELCLYLMGRRGGTQYGLSVGMLPSQTETIEVHSPELNIARTAVLDYFMYQQEHKFVQIMRWEDSYTNMWGTELEWLGALGREWAFPQPNHPKYLCGGLIIKNWPELQCYRDVAYYFKWFLNTDPKAHPPAGRPYAQSQAKLNWRVTPRGFEVVSTLLPPKFPMFCRPRPGIPWGHRFETFADPSKLTGHTVNTEDDVLHIKNLPGFPVSEIREVKDEKGNLKEEKVPRVVIGQKDSELLMSYLTVPYMRVPLVISFFATEDRIHALRSKQLRDLLDSVMFEPGSYLPLGVNQEPKEVPTRNSQLLATPYGLLINELHRSPDAVMQSVIRLLEFAIDLDTGSFKASTVDIILYIVRLGCRVDSYVDFMIQIARGTHECIRTPMRDVNVTDNVVAKLEGYLTALRALLRGRMHTIVEGYINEAMREIQGKEDDEVVDRNTKVACRMHTHLLLMYRNVQLEQLTPEIASTLLCGFVFLTIRHTWNMGLMEIPEFELYELLQVMRRRLVTYTRSLDQVPLNDLMEAAVRVSTGTGFRKLIGGKKSARNWAYIRGARSVGRFTVLTARSRFYQIAESKVREVEDNKELGVEIDWQIIQLTLRSSHLKALSKSIAANPDVTMIFGSKSMQAATIQDAEHREWVRLVGRQHDIQHWRTPDPRLAEQELMREYDPTELEESERWILPIWEPVRKKFFIPPPPNPPIPIWLPEKPLEANAQVCYMIASHPKKGGTIKEIFVFKELQMIQIYDVMSHGRRFYRSLVYSTDARYSLRDLQPPVGQRKSMWVSWGRHEAGNPWSGDRAQGVSCVITRHRDYHGNLSGTEEQLIPERLLYGIVPSCLFETHRFWQDANDNIHGYPIGDDKGPILCIDLKGLRKVGSLEEAGVCARITRVPYKLFKARMMAMEQLQGEMNDLKLGPAISSQGSNDFTNITHPADKNEGGDDGRVKSVDEVELTMVNMLYAPPKSKIFNMFKTLKRIEKLSYMVCWTRSTDPEGGDFDIDLVELPRLKMSFVGRKDHDGRTQLYSMDHSDLFVSNERSMLTCSLLRGIPHSLLMQNANGEMKILVPCVHPVRPPIESAPFSTELVMNYANRPWLEQLSQRYFLYPVHISLSFLFTPTLSSALYLLLLRFLHRDYGTAFRLVDSIGTDAVFLDEEAMIFMDLKQCNSDKHPDAHAVRLAISHVMIDSEGALTSPNQQFMDIYSLKHGESFTCHVTGKEYKQEGTIYFKCNAPNGPQGFTACQRVMEGKVPLPWNLTNDMTGFVTKLEHVSSICRLTHVQQLEILERCICDTNDPRFDPRKYTEYGIILNKNRIHYLQAMLSGQENAPCFVVPRIPEQKWPLRVNRTAIGGASMSNDGVASLSVMYEAAPSYGGYMALQAAQKFLTPRGQPLQYENTRGQIWKLGFLFIYNLYTGTTKCKIGGNDDSKCLALLLTQLLHDRNEGWNPLISILDIIGKNQHIIPALPKFRDTRRNKHPRISVLCQGDEKVSPLATLLERLFSKLPVMDRERKLQYPDGEYDQLDPPEETCPVIQPEGRKFIVPRLSDLQCSERLLKGIDAKQVENNDLEFPTDLLMPFTNQPMKKYIDAKWHKEPEDEDDPLLHYPEEDEDDKEEDKAGNLRPIMQEFKLDLKDNSPYKAEERLPFDVQAHPQAQSEVARIMLRRYADDVKNFAKRHNSQAKLYLDSLFEADVDVMLQTSQSGGGVAASEAERKDLSQAAIKRALGQMGHLIDAMKEERDEDAAYVDIGLSYIQRVANKVDPPPSAAEEPEGQAMVDYHTFLLNRMCNQETKIWMEYLIGCLLSTKSVSDLQKLNPYFNEKRVNNVKDVICVTILRANRVGQLNRAIDATRKVVKLLTKLKKMPGPVTAPSVRTGLVLSAEKIVANLTCKRYFMDNKEEKEGLVKYDPRYLVFEFVWNILLRKKQVVHVREYLQVMQKGGSIVKQLIMGSGKTMVIGPLLCLMLSDGKTLVTMSVPRALLELTRSNLRNTFSSIMSKRIFTLKFDRASQVQPRLLRKLTLATEKSGIVISNPTSIKSMMLKIIELLHTMTDPASKKNERIDYERDRNLVVQCLAKFKSSILIMDEVDLILHPLKSELNFPIGEKVKLDFSPERWELPIHLVDAIFSSTLGRMSVKFEDSSEASRILEELKSRLEEGYKQRALFKFPHVILLNPDFYHKFLKPVLADWAMLWMETKHFRGLEKDDLKIYLLHGARPDPGKVVEMEKRLELISAASKAKELNALQMQVLKLPNKVLSDEQKQLLEEKEQKLVLSIKELKKINQERKRIAPLVSAIHVPSHRKMLNLAHDYLKMYMPHIMQKINRVSFGLMNTRDKMRALAENPYMPRTRYMLAIPFVGKDVPSRASEFAHPDVVIGLTILAYRYSGLRWEDFDHIVGTMRNKLFKEGKGPVKYRPTNRLHEYWVKTAKGFIKGSKEEKKARKLAAKEKLALEEIEPQMSELGQGLKNYERECKSEEELKEFYETKKYKEYQTFVAKRAGNDEAVAWLEKGTVVALRLLQRSNSEQMNKLFDLWKDLPETIHFYLQDYVFEKYMRHQKVKLSACGQELGGAMLFPRRIGFSGTPSDLMPVELGSCDYEKCADGQMFYKLTSTVICSHQMIGDNWSVSSLLDIIAKGTWSALIDVGALVTGLSNYDVAKYLLDNGLPWCDGVVFLDDMDRKMILVRATGRVVKLSQCGIPEERRFAFYDQVHTTGMDIRHKLDAVAILTIGKDMTWRDYAQAAYRMRGIGKGQGIRLFIIPEIYRHMTRELRKAGIVIEKDAEKAQGKNVLNHVAAWLVINSMRMERIQFNMLQMQNVANIWRKRGFEGLIKQHHTFKLNRKQPDVYLRKCLDMFREPLDFSVESSIPEPRIFAETIDKMIEENKQFVMGADEKLTEKVKEVVAQADKMLDLSYVALEAEQQQEAEAEQEQQQEQEQEQEQEEEIEIEKYVDVAYQRDNEAPIPWEFLRLRDKNFCSQFYDASNFKLYKGKPVVFPPYVQVSDNYFNRTWGGERRIKNIIMTMEWVPKPSEVKEYPPRDIKIPPKWRDAFDTAFRMFDQDNSGTMEVSEVAKMIRAATDAQPTEEELKGIMVEFGGGGGSTSLSRDGLLQALQSGTLRPEYRGRYTVAVSLAEAETIRRIMHMRLEKKLIDGSDMQLALRCSEAKNMIFDRSANFQNPTRYQREASWQSLRYLNCEMYFQDAQLNTLIRAMQYTPIRERVVFFMTILGCRRRATYRWKSTPLSKLFKILSEFHMLKNRSQAVRMRESMKEKGLLPYDAFRMFNVKKTGQLSPAEVWGALVWLGLKDLTPKDIFGFVEAADKNGDRNIDYQEFLDILRNPDAAASKEGKEGDSQLDDDDLDDDDDDAKNSKSSRPEAIINAEVLKSYEDKLMAYEDKELKEEGKHQMREIKEAQMAAQRRRAEIETEEEEKQVMAGQMKPNPESSESCVVWDFTTSRKPVGVAKMNDSHYHMRRQGQNYLKIYANSAITLTPNIRDELKGNMGGERINAYTIVMEIKFDSLPRQKKASDDMKDGDMVPTERALLNLNRLEESDAVVSIDSDGAIGIAGVFDKRVKMVAKKWHFLTIVADCKEGKMTAYIDGMAANTLDAKGPSSSVSSPLAPLELDSQDFSVSPDKVLAFFSTDSSKMDCEIDVKRVWLYRDAKSETMVGLMNEEFMSRDPWRVGR